MAIRHSYVLKTGDGSKVTFPNRKIHEVYTPPNSCQEYQNSLSNINNLTGHSLSGQTFLDITNDVLGAGNYKLVFKDGSWQTQAGLLQDTNGNWCCGTDDGWVVDSLGRRVAKWSGTVGMGDLSYYDSDGSLQTVVLQAGGPVLPLPQPTFPTTNLFYQPQWQPTSMPSEMHVTLPGNLVYVFSSADPDNPNQLNAFGEVTKITLPGGGYIKYKYATIPQRDALEPDLSGGYTAQPAALDSRVLVEKRISDGTGPERLWTYVYGSGTDEDGFFQTTTVTDPDGHVEIHTFRGDPTGRMREVAVEYRQGASVPLKRVQTDWAWDNGAVSAGMPVHQSGSYADGFQMGHRNDRVTRTTTTLLDSGQTSKISKIETDFTDCFQYSLPVGYLGSFTYTDCRENPTTVREYDYGTDPDNLPLRRTTTTSYVHQDDPAYNSAHIWDLVRDQQTLDASGAVKARNYFWYDQNTLYSTSGVPYHNSVSGPRGNRTHDWRFRLEDSTWLATVKAFNDVGNVIASTDPGNHTTYFDYTDNFTDGQNRNSQGFLTRVTLPQTGSVQHIERKQYYWYTGLTAAECGQNYPAGSTCAFTTAPSNADHRTYTYDLLNRPRNVYRALGTAANPQVGHAELTYPDAVTVRLQAKLNTQGQYSDLWVKYDGLGRQVQTAKQVPAPFNWIVNATCYDAGGKVSKKTNPVYSAGGFDPSPCSNLAGDTFTYDGLGRLLTTTHVDGSVASVSYSGNTTTYTDESGRKRKNASDALGRLTEVWEDPAGANYLTSYKYDTLDNLLCVEQRGNAPSSTANCNNPADGVFGGNWRVRKFKYNSLGQLLETRNPESGVITYAYSNDGDLISKTAPKANQSGGATVTSTFAYDALHRLTDKTFNDGTQNASFVYDAATFWGVSTGEAIGRRVAATAAGGTIGSIAAYDRAGRVRQTWECIPGAPGGCNVFYYGYRPDGALETMNYPSGRALSHGYDTAGRLNDVKFNYFGQTYPNYHYWQVPNTVGSLPGFHPSGAVQYADYGNNMRENTPQDNRLRMNGIYTYHLGTGQVLTDRVYHFQTNSNISRIADAVTPGRSQNFIYDALNRIYEAWSDAGSGSDAWGQRYTIDPWGNLTKKLAYDGSRANPEALDQSAQPENVITGFTYDSAGNMTQNGGASYTYDGENRIVTTAGYTYTYDADGKRIKKQATADPNNATYYYYGAGSTVLAERTGAGAWTDYIFAGSKRVAKADAEPYISSTEYYHSDHLGTASWMTNSVGTQIYSATYLPYGYEFNASGPTTNHYKFTGKERDAESNLDYFGARYYGSTTGRFATVDPFDPLREFDRKDEEEDREFREYIGDPQNWNRYTYVLNRPLTHVDEDGRVPVVVLIPLAIRVGMIAAPVVARYGPQILRTIQSAGPAVSQRIYALPQLIRGGVLELAKGTSNAWRFTKGIDHFSNGNAVSVKSIDIFARSYQSTSALASKLGGYVNQLANYNGGRTPDGMLRGEQITSRTLQVVLPKGELTAEQLKVLAQIAAEAAKKGVQVQYFQVK